jgi:hypothetical protein
MTEEEIAGACAELGLPRPLTLPTVPGEPSGEPGLGVREPWAVDLLRTLAEPRAVVFYQGGERGGRAETSVTVLGPPWAVEQVPLIGGSYQLSLFDGVEISARFAELFRLPDGPAPPGRPCEVSASTFAAAFASAGEDEASTARLLRADGVGSRDAEPLAMALARWHRTAQVSVMHRPGPAAIQGTITSWFDSGPDGLWQIVAPRLAGTGDFGDVGGEVIDAASVVVGPATRRELMAEMAGGLPPDLNGFGLAGPGEPVQP